jgi:hypothetical protein
MHFPSISSPVLLKEKQQLPLGDLACFPRVNIFLSAAKLLQSVSFQSKNLNSPYLGGHFTIFYCIVFGSFWFAEIWKFKMFYFFKFTSVKHHSRFGYAKHKFKIYHTNKKKFKEKRNHTFIGLVPIDYCNKKHCDVLQKNSVFFDNFLLF